MTDWGAGDRLAEAARVRREADGLRSRLEAATQHAELMSQRVEEARDRLAQEDRDVQRHESLSWSRILSSLKGDHVSDLERERAERDAARYTVAEAEARHEMAWREAQALEAQLDALGDVDAGFASALLAQEEWARGSQPETARRLAAIDVRRGELDAEDHEGREAFEAGQRARGLLLQARDLLGGARSWSTWDTFGGGGLFSDMMKYDKLDQVASVLRAADEALGHFSRELADVRLAGVAAVNLDGMTRAFDVFFDNIFSDLAVRSRIQDAEARVAHALVSVERTMQALSERGRDIGAERAGLAREREGVLTG